MKHPLRESSCNRLQKILEGNKKEPDQFFTYSSIFAKENSIEINIKAILITFG